LRLPVTGHTSGGSAADNSGFRSRVERAVHDEQSHRRESRVSQGNRLLSALQRDCPKLQSPGELIELTAGAELQASGRAISHVYFPLTAALTLAVQTEAGVPL
jgi:hypothetical protein